MSDRRTRYLKMRERAKRKHARAKRAGPNAIRIDKYHHLPHGTTAPRVWEPSTHLLLPLNAYLVDPPAGPFIYSTPPWEEFPDDRRGRGRPPHPTLVTPHPLFYSASYEVIGYQRRRVHVGPRLTGTGGNFARFSKLAWLYYVSRTAEWPSWDPKHRTPVDPFTDPPWAF